MQTILAEIKDGSFAARFIADQDAGAPEFKALRKKGEQHPIEKVGRELRGLMSWVSSDDDCIRGRRRPMNFLPPRAARGNRFFSIFLRSKPAPEGPRWEGGPGRSPQQPALARKPVYARSQPSLAAPPWGKPIVTCADSGYRPLAVTRRACAAGLILATATAGSPDRHHHLEPPATASPQERPPFQLR